MDHRDALAAARQSVRQIRDDAKQRKHGTSEAAAQLAIDALYMLEIAVGTDTDRDMQDCEIASAVYMVENHDPDLADEFRNRLSFELISDRADTEALRKQMGRTTRRRPTE